MKSKAISKATVSQDMQVVQPTKGTPKVETVKVETVKAPHAPCVCGCGGVPAGKRSRFLPGHDARMVKEHGVATDVKVEIPVKVKEKKPKSTLVDIPITPELKAKYGRIHSSKVMNEDTIRRNIPGEKTPERLQQDKFFVQSA